VFEDAAAVGKVDRTALDAAIATLAAYDEEDGLESASGKTDADAEGSSEIPDVALDRNIADTGSTQAADDDVAALEEAVALLDRAKTLEDVSDTLAETLFGCDELEAISLKIRENVANGTPDLEELAAAGIIAQGTPEPVSSGTPEPPPTPTPKVAQASAQPPVPPVSAAPAAGPAPVPQKVTNIEMSSGPAPDSALPPASGPQPEPIERQFTTSMTSTLQTLSTHMKLQADSKKDKEAQSGSVGLLGRLKGTFKS
jgi:hypothetical protein